jgi:hypothetical protein
MACRPLVHEIGELSKKYHTPFRERVLVHELEESVTDLVKPPPHNFYIHVHMYD